MRDIALIGRSRSGKDTVAAMLREAYGHRRVAFADPLKDAALRVDPWVNHYHVNCPDDSEADRLSEVVGAFGWERAKDEYPEVRRFLQNLGVAVRGQNPRHWVDQALREVVAAWKSGESVVITDCRFENEAQVLRERGFLLVRITRPGSAADQHVSEMELSGYPVNAEIRNNGTLDELRAEVDRIAAM